MGQLGSDSSETGVCGDRFALTRVLGAGGMGEVHLAYDRVREREVAVKVLRADRDASFLQRLRREFRVLSDIAHPNLCALYGLHEHAGRNFISMEYVDGVAFDRWCLPEPPTDMPRSVDADGDGETWFDLGDDGESEDKEDELQEVDTGSFPVIGADIGRVRAALGQLAEAVGALHAAGRVHRDLKPGNVIVGHDGRVVVLDFGLVRAEDDAAVSQAALEGTPAYMAPERFRGGGDGVEADWFAVGVMLFEALVGARPFRTTRQVRDLTSAELVNPQSIVGGVPGDLAGLCLALLHPEPDRRAGLAEIRAVVGSHAAGLPPLLSGSGFVGRKTCLTTLHEAVDTARSGRDALVRVVGASGYGKSALLKHFSQQLTDSSGAPAMLLGRCYEREAVPFRMFDGIIEQLSARVGRRELASPWLDGLDSRFGERSIGHLGEHETVDASTSPSLDQVTHGGLRPDNVVSAVATLSALLGRITVPGEPVVVLLDDVQWADFDSIHMLGELLSVAARPRLMLVLASRAEEAENPLVRSLDRLLEVHVESSSITDHRSTPVLSTVELGPLSLTDARELVATIDGGDDLDVAGLLAETSGSPLLLHELATLRSAGLLDADAGLEEAVRLHVSVLAPETQALFRLVCLAGHPLEQADAWSASGGGRAREEAVHALRTAGLVRTSGGEPTDAIEPAHDRVREMVDSWLEDGLRQQMHRCLAEVLDGNPNVDSAIRAAHWRDGGDDARAGRLAARAADLAERSGAWDRLVDMTDLMLAVATRDEESRRSLQLRRARALRASGRCLTAARAFGDVAKGAPPELSRSLRMQAMEQLLIGGFHEDGLAAGDEVLREVGLRRPRTALGLVLALGWERFRLWLTPKAFRANVGTANSQKVASRLQACWGMATGLSIIDSRLAAVFTAKYLRIALHAGDRLATARGLALEAGHQASAGSLRTADELLVQANELAESVSRASLPPFIALMTGFVRYFQGRWSDAAAAYDAAVRGYEVQRTGANWEQSTAHIFGIWALVYAGEWRELRRRAARLRRRAVRGHNRYLAHGYHIGSGVVTSLLDDRPTDAALAIDEAMRDWQDHAFQIQHFLALYMGGWVSLYEGKGGAAWTHICSQWPKLRRSLLLEVQDVRMRMHHIRGYAAIGHGGSAALADALRSARALHRIDVPGAGAVASTIEAGVAAHNADWDTVRLRLKDAQASFQAAEMVAYAAAVGWRLAEAEQNEDAREEARGTLIGLGVRRPERMIDVLAPLPTVAHERGAG